MGFCFHCFLQGLSLSPMGNPPAVTRAERDLPTPAHTTTQHPPPPRTPRPGEPPSRALHLVGTAHSIIASNCTQATQQSGESQIQRLRDTRTGHPAPARLPASTGITSCNEKPRDCDRSTWSTLRFGNMWLAIQLFQTSLVFSDLDFQLPSLTLHSSALLQVLAP